MKLFLRVGVMRAGKLVDDRFLPETGTVTFGSGVDNTINLIGTSLPDSTTLVHFEGHHPVLHVVDGMKGEIALDGKTRESLESLRARGKAGTGVWTIQLPDTARGWVSFGGVTFFLQSSPKPPPPPPTTLPKEARTGIFSGLESTFAAALVGVLALEGVGVAAIHRRPYIDADAPIAAEDLDRFVTVATVEEKPKPKEEKKEDDEAKKKAEEDAKKKAEKDDEADKKKTPVDAAQAKAQRDAEIRERAQKAVIDFIGGGDGSGAFGTVLAGNSGQLADVDAALSNARGGIATVDDGYRSARGGGAGGPMTIGDLSASIGAGGKGNTKAAVLGEKKAPIAAPVEIETSLIDVPSANFSSDELVRSIKGRMGAVKACYDRELKLDPNLKGKISMRFTITPLGRVSDVSVERSTMGNDNVAECIMRLIRTWSFSFKPDDEVSVSFPFVFTQGG